MNGTIKQTEKAGEEPNWSTPLVQPSTPIPPPPNVRPPIPRPVTPPQSAQSTHSRLPTTPEDGRKSVPLPPPRKNSPIPPVPPSSSPSIALWQGEERKKESPIPGEIFACDIQIL